MSRCADHLLETFSSRTVPALPHSIQQRSRQIMRLPRPKKEVQRRSPLYCAPTLWNSLPADLQKLANWNSLTFFFFRARFSLLPAFNHNHSFALSLQSTEMRKNNCALHIDTPRHIRTHARTRAHTVTPSFFFFSPQPFVIAFFWQVWCSRE